MNYKPDYGLYCLNSGVSPKTDQFFYDFRLYSLTVLGSGMFSTMVEIPRNGKTYALSLDFNQRQLEQILARASKHLRSTIVSALRGDPNTLRTMDFEEAVSFGVRARLGEIQIAEKEKFVPLVVQEIF